MLLYLSLELALEPTSCPSTSVSPLCLLMALLGSESPGRDRSSTRQVTLVKFHTCLGLYEVGHFILWDLAVDTGSFHPILLPSEQFLLFPDHGQVKYLGEDREKVPVAGAVAICSPWDLLGVHYLEYVCTKGEEHGVHCSNGFEQVLEWGKVEGQGFCLILESDEVCMITKSAISGYLLDLVLSQPSILLTARSNLLVPAERKKNFTFFLSIGDRFICRRLVQKLYDRALTIGLQGYAKLGEGDLDKGVSLMKHEPQYSRLANWEGIKKSRSIRDFDNFATCLVAKYETVDAYYRRCSSSSYVQNVSVPLLCISALDDPVCTREAIPWDECRANKNIVLATLQHGGHLAFFEGIRASRLWATEEFLDHLHCSPYMHVQKTENSDQQLSLESTIDQGPFVNVAEDGMVAAVGNEHAQNNIVEDVSGLRNIQPKKCDDGVSTSEQNKHLTASKSDVIPCATQVSEQSSNWQDVKSFDVISPLKRFLNHLSHQNGKSMWLLVYIAIITSWPIVGSTLRIFSRKKLRNVSPAASQRR
ncbi:hypothetical protein COLO4_35563 [Corchorus olitorius]|uniref:Embryogenesis-associated protein EMB8 n=1 Tax=Corchorus olitorius TaxID=93759 RepID=A0A1R3GF82_9ROSI|nr:hypothetical protein COLO4_35563 [Corchorus olitorius]